MGTKRVLMVAAENDGLAGGKVGGIGDVVRDVAPVLAGQGWAVDIVTPSYGFLHKATGAEFITSIRFSFGAEQTVSDLYSVPGKRSYAGVHHFVFDHPMFVWVDRGRPQIYQNDPPATPFASGRNKVRAILQSSRGSARQGGISLTDLFSSA